MQFHLSDRRFIFSTLILLICLTLATVLWHQQPISQIPNSKTTAGLEQDKPSKLSPADEQTRAKLIESYGKVPLHFELNEGQIESDEIKFTSRGDGYNLFLSPTNAKLILSKPSASSEKNSLKNSPNQSEIELEQESDAQSREQSVIEMNLVGANHLSKAKAVEQLEGKSNYFIGNDQSKWKTNVSNYKKVKFEEVYSGIDIEYYGNQRELEYDFIVKPNADPKQIRLEFDGAENIKVNEEGELVLETTQSEQIKQKKPFIYQIGETGEKEEVAGSYKIEEREEGKEVSFEIEDYDKSKQLIIDPIVLVYSTYLGGNDLEECYGIVVDSAGNAYLTGRTISSNFPLANAIQPAYGGSGSDVFITKINSSGSALVYSTYLGGIGFDSDGTIAVDSDGNAYITGYTNSTNFPLRNPLRPTYAGGASEAFVTKINPSGSELVYSTFLGGSSGDSGSDIAADFEGNAYITGYTFSTNFPVVNARRSKLNGGIDAFVTKINSSGSAFIYSIYLGGNGDDSGDGIAVDSDRNAYVTGSTESSNFPVANARQSTFGGTSDAFVTKINSLGNVLIYSTYLGGNGNDSGYEIATDSDRNAYVTGGTSSANFPVSNAIQSRIGGGRDAFVTKLNSTGSAYIYSTYLGGASLDEGYSITTDSIGNAYVVGYTTSEDFPIVNALQPLYSQGNVSNVSDAFVTKLKPSGNAFAFSTYFGGSSSDLGSSIALDNDGYIYLTGWTESRNFPIANAIQPIKAGTAGTSLKSCQDVFYPNFSSTSGLQLNGSATSVNNVLRLTPAQPEQRGSAWLTTKRAVEDGFSTTIHFKITNGEANGFTFTIQNSPSGTAALGGNPSCGDCLGYTGITNSVSVQFDAFRNEVRVATNGSSNPIATATSLRDLNDGSVHRAFIHYFRGVMDIFIGAGNSGILNLRVPMDISNFGLDNGEAYVGFTAATGTSFANHEILDWRFSPGCYSDLFISKLSIPTSSVSGRVTTTSGQPLFGVQLNSSGDTSNKTLSDNNGNFLIELIQGNNHTFAPTFSTHRFSPPAYSFTPLSISQSNVNFTATLINDNFADAVTLTGAFGNVSGNSLDATRQTVEPNHASQSGNRSVWYKIRSQTTGQAAFSTYGSSFDTVLAVYTGTSLNNLTQVAENDDAASFDQTSRVTFGAVAGTDYWIAVDGKQPGQSGNFKLNYFTTSVTVSGVVTKQGVPQPNLTVRATSTDNNTVAYTTTAANGSYSLTIPAGSYNFAVLQGSVQQGQAVTVLDVSADRTQNIEIEPSNSNEFSGIGSIRLPVNAIIDGMQARAEAADGTILPCQLFDNATRFTCSGLVPGGSYLIKVTSPNYEFAPNDIPLNNVQSNYLNLKFEATHYLRGRIVNGNNRVSGATVSVTGNTPQGLSINTKTNATGEYIARVPTGYNYQVTPSLTGMAFTPPVSSFKTLSNHQIADFSVVNSCNEQSYSVNPTSSVTVPAEGTDSLAINLSTSQNCSWTASSNEQWITVNQSNQSGTSSRAVSFFVYPNPALVSRSAIITIAGKSVTVVQEAAAANSSVRFDFDGDSKADIGVFRPDAGAWYLQQSTAGFSGIGFGLAEDLIAPADFDADRKTDVAVFRPSTGSWYLLNSSNNQFAAIQFGQSGDIPLPSDFDGDGKADINVFRPLTGSWYRLNSSTGEFYGIQFGQVEDIPLAADFDGDGKSDIAVFRPSGGAFYWLRSTDGQFQAAQFGIETDKPTPADFDGDGKTDIAVYRPENGAWYRLNSSTGEFVGIQFGISTDKPTPADYDGDGKTDIAVYRPENGAWYLLQSTSGFAGVRFGIATDKPIPNAFIPEIY